MREQDIGIDISRLGVAMNPQRSNVVVASGTHLPFRDKIFKQAWSMGTMMHIKGTVGEKAIKEAKRVSNRVIFIEAHNIPSVALHAYGVEGRPISEDMSVFNWNETLR